MKKIRTYNDELGLYSDAELPKNDRSNLELNINQDKKFYFLHVFSNNIFLFSIQAKERINIDDYLSVNNLKATNDFVKKIYNK